LIKQEKLQSPQKRVASISLKRSEMTLAQFSLFLHSDQAHNTLSGIQGREATAVAVI